MICTQCVTYLLASCVHSSLSFLYIKRSHLLYPYGFLYSHLSATSTHRFLLLYTPVSFINQPLPTFSRISLYSQSLLWLPRYYMLSINLVSYHDLHKYTTRLHTGELIDDQLNTSLRIDIDIPRYYLVWYLLPG
jgi:hypothetical protein